MPSIPLDPVYPIGPDEYWRSLQCDVPLPILNFSVSNSTQISPSASIGLALYQSIADPRRSCI